MLNNDITPENMEVETPSPLSSTADHSLNEEEEEERKTLESEGSTEGNSLLDLRKRLQNLPPLNETPRLTNRTINSCRLPQKHDFYFHGITSCIEEKEEEEERLPFPRKSFSELIAKDARARRRAKTRLEAVTSRTMVVSQPNDVDTFELKSSSNKLNSTIENNLELPSLMVETPRNSSRYTPSPIETPANPYRSQTFDNDSFRLQNNAFSQSEESSKDKIDLHSFSAISLGRIRPTKFGGYRPPTGVILQNLSSGSEPELHRETTLHRIVPSKNIASSMFSNEIDQTFTVCLSSTSPTFDDTVTNGGTENLATSALFTTEGGNDRLASSPLSSLREKDSPSYKLLDILKRNSVHDKQAFGSSLAIPAAQIQGDVSLNISETGTFVNTYPKLAGFEKNGPVEGIPQLKSKITSSVSNCENKNIKFPLSARTVRTEATALCSEFRSCMSEGDAISFREFKGLSLRASIKDDQQSIESGNQNLDNYVPTLALNSQEMSYSASPVSKAFLGKHLNTNGLIMALSNVSLKQKMSNALEDIDNETTSGYFENNLTTEKYGETKFSGNLSRNDVSPSMRSKIPIKISSHRNKLVFNKFPDAKKQTSSEISSIDTEQRYETLALQIFERSYSPSEDCSTTRQTSIDENEYKKDTQYQTYRASNQLSTNRSTIEDTIRSTSFSETEKEDKIIPAEDSDSIPSESESIEDSFGALSVPESKPKNYENYTHPPELKSCQTRYPETKSNLIKNQIGDSVCQAVSNSSLDADKEMKNDRNRLSLEKLAAEQFRRNFCVDQTQTQSDTDTLHKERFYNGSSFTVVHSSSTSKVCPQDSPRSGRKSQDRFPFTISEKPSAASMKFKISRRLGNLDSESIDRRYKLNMHPSITRLAGAGIEDTPAEIISYIGYNENEQNEASSSGIKRFVQRFSAKLKRSRKSDKVRPDKKITSVIYENRAYHRDSTVDSCSDSSLLKEFKEYERAMDSLGTKASISSPKRHKRDNVWVQEFENLDQNEILIMSKDECERQRDPYRMFFVKSAQETPATFPKSFLSDEEQKQDTPDDRKRKNRVKFRSSSLAIASKSPDKNVYRKFIESRNLDDAKNRRTENRGCLCLRFYRMIVPASFSSLSKYQSRVNRNDRLSIRNRSGLLLQKRKG